MKLLKYLLFVVVFYISFFDYVYSITVIRSMLGTNMLTTTSITCGNNACNILFIQNNLGVFQTYIRQFTLESMFDESATNLIQYNSIDLGVFIQGNILKEFNIQQNNVVISYNARYYLSATKTTLVNPDSVSTFPSITLGPNNAYVTSYVGSSNYIKMIALVGGGLPSTWPSNTVNYGMDGQPIGPPIYDLTSNFLYVFTVNGITRFDELLVNPLSFASSLGGKANAVLDTIHSRFYFMALVSSDIQVQGIDIANLTTGAFDFTYNAARTTLSSFLPAYQSTFDSLQGIGIFMYISQGLSNLIFVDTFTGNTKEINDIPKIRDGSYITWSNNPSNITANSAVFYMTNGLTVVSVDYENFCPGVCNYLGICRNGVCVCNDGLFGESCGSIEPTITEITQVPLLSSTLVTITGSEFYNPIVQIQGQNITVTSSTYSTIKFNLNEFTDFNDDNLYEIKVYSSTDTTMQFPAIYSNFGFILPTLDSYIQDGLELIVDTTNIPDSASNFVVTFQGMTVNPVFENGKITLTPYVASAVGDLVIECDLCFFSVRNIYFSQVSLMPVITGPTEIPLETATVDLTFAYSTARTPLTVYQHGFGNQSIPVSADSGEFIVGSYAIPSTYFLVYYGNGHPQKFIPSYNLPTVLQATQNSSTQINILVLNSGTNASLINIEFNGNSSLVGQIQSIVNSGTPLSNIISVIVPPTAISGFVDVQVLDRNYTTQFVMKSKVHDTTKPSTSGIGGITISGSYLTGTAFFLPDGDMNRRYSLECSIQTPLQYVCDVVPGTGNFDLVFENNNVISTYPTSFALPVITSVSPNNIFVNSGNTTVTITGDNFGDDGTSVSIDNIDCEIISGSISFNSIKCVFVSPLIAPKNTLLKVLVTVDSLKGSNDVLQLNLYCPKGKDGEECSGNTQGTCQRETGLCKCSKGFSSENCSTIVPIESSDVSSSNLLLQPLNIIFSLLLISIISIQL